MPDTTSAAMPRAQGLQMLEHAAGQARQQEQALAVLTLDVDHFKNFQDEAGAAPAQAVIEQLAGLLRASVPAAARLVHLGSDEFFVVLPEADITAAQSLGENLRQAVADGLAGVNARPPLTVTVGVAASPAEGGWSGAELLALADMRMTFAKRRLTPHHNLCWAGSLPSDWYTRLDIDPRRWPSL
jgi:diguanylate cyclase (GGDEF)-like protein